MQLTPIQILEAKKAHYKRVIDARGNSINENVNMLKKSIPLTLLVNFVGRRVLGNTFSYLPVITTGISLIANIFKKKKNREAGNTIGSL